jgi:hypothetical protein
VPAQSSDALDRPRMITLVICGARIQLQVKDPTTEWDLRLQAFLKDQAIGRKGGLPPLLHEEWLMEYDAEAKCVVPKERSSIHIACSTP